MPVEVIAGENDPFFPPAYAKRMADGMPDARLHMLLNCGHVPQLGCGENSSSFFWTFWTRIDKSAKPAWD